MKPGHMLSILEVAELALPELLLKRELWKSVLVDYEPPTVERIWTPFSHAGQDYRILLHRLNLEENATPLFHPHPWPSAMRILRGAYYMNFGVSSTMDPPKVVMRQYLTAGCRYEMADPDGWHSVAPVEQFDVYTVMVTGKPWDRPAHKPTKQLKELDEWTVNGLIQTFAAHYT